MSIFFIRANVDNADRVLSTLHAFGFSGLGLTVDDFATASQVIQLGQPPNRIDILTGISSVDFDEAWKGRVAAELDGLPVSFIGRDALS